MDGDPEPEHSQGYMSLRGGGTQMIPSRKCVLCIIFWEVWPFTGQVDLHNRNGLGLSRTLEWHYFPLDQFSSQTGM